MKYLKSSIPDPSKTHKKWLILIPWLVTRDPGSMIPIPGLWSLIPYTWLRPWYLNLYNSACFVTSVCQLLLWELFCASILLTEYKRKWRKSTVVKKGKHYGKSRLFTINTVILFLVAILRLHSYQICIKQTWVVGNATLSIWMRRARITRASLILRVFYVEQVVGKKVFPL